MHHALGNSGLDIPVWVTIPEDVSHSFGKGLGPQVQHAFYSAFAQAQHALALLCYRGSHTCVSIHTVYRDIVIDKHV